MPTVHQRKDIVRRAQWTEEQLSAAASAVRNADAVNTQTEENIIDIRERDAASHRQGSIKRPPIHAQKSGNRASSGGAAKETI
ncbi:hypothetical protein ILUMI_19219 [Ignelater luminosus]|uniref:Uncharacterized protein n=1 Tax=Ignelater luminosus TaxID=2038154 RepID=A0A8K0CIJ9_IGNLU|nr:hypothetical protein ILUMI_19219 [Ignelater luminosus]